MHWTGKSTDSLHLLSELLTVIIIFYLKTKLFITLESFFFSPAKIAAVNERLRLLERNFIEPAALPNELNYKWDY